MGKFFILICGIFFIPFEAPGEPFAGNDLFFGKVIKQTTRAKHFSAGIEFQISPLKAILKSQMEKIKNEACAQTSDKDLCLQQTNLVLENAKYVSEDIIKNKEYENLKNELLKVEGLTEEEKKQIEQINFNSPEYQTSINLLSDTILDKESAVTFALIPYGELNLNLVDIKFELPLAGFSLGGDTDFVIGNITIEGKFGHHFSLGVGTLGLSYGLGVNLPTGSEKANALGLSNILIGPKFYKEYLTLSPYVAGGLDLHFVIIQVSTEMVNMIKVRGGKASGTPIYLKYGFGVSVVPLPLFSLVAEVDGVKNIEKADAFNGVFLTAGLYFNFALINFGVGAQIPIATSEEDKYATFGGLPFGSPSKINVLANAYMKF